MDHLFNCHGEINSLLALLPAIPIVGVMIAGWLSGLFGHNHHEHGRELNGDTILRAILSAWLTPAVAHRDYARCMVRSGHSNGRCPPHERINFLEAFG